MEVEGLCPYCGEPIALWIDEGGGGAQRYIEDCSICCRPIDVRVAQDEEGEPSVGLHRLDE